jgi:GT2 family glycosyltransferase
VKISIIIVNYNVEFYLEQCLLSVEKAMKGIDGEIWVVDNNSADRSNRMLEKKFPKVRLVKNSENFGFSVANNQAIRQAKGDYILLLNPDTIVEEDTLHRTIAYMEENPQVGALGVKMLDGNGNFLAESKRGLPTPWVGFYKIVGLAKLFPKSLIFGKYHLGYLNKEEIHEVEVLAGAFMLIQKKVLDKIGLLDERFFMYGEDIDLSYRITQAGFKNVYFPKTSIIHFKGESTKKDSTNYVFVFYRAMLLFAQKHFSQQNAQFFGIIIHLAIYFRAFGALLYRILNKISLPILDVALLFGGIYFIQDYWEITYLSKNAYPWYYLVYVIPTYILIWLLSSLYSSAYDRPYSIGKSIRGIGFGSLIILVIYALLPENLRFSRAIILLSTIWGIFSLSALRAIFSLFHFSAFLQKKSTESKVAIIGHAAEARRVAELYRNSSIPPAFIGLISPNQQSNLDEGVVGELSQLPALINIYGLNELVFCSASMPAWQIIQLMTKHSNSKLSFKIAPHDSSAVIGSSSILQASDLFVIDIDGILKPNNRRTKRTFDFVSALFLLFTFPIGIWIVKNKVSFLRNCLLVFLGRASWIGYDAKSFDSNERLPAIRKGILHPKDAFPGIELDTDSSARLNLMYARDYKLKNDIQILLKGIRELGRSD